MSAYEEKFRVDYDEDTNVLTLIRIEDNVIIKRGEFVCPNCFIIGDKSYFGVHLHNESDSIYIYNLVLIDLDTWEEITIPVESVWFSILSNGTGNILFVIELVAEKYPVEVIYEKIDDRYQRQEIKYDDFNDTDRALLGPKYPLLDIDEYHWVNDITIEAQSNVCKFRISRDSGKWKSHMVEYTPEFAAKLAHIHQEEADRSAYKERVKAENPRYAELAQYFTIESILLPLHPRDSPYYRDSQYADPRKYVRDLCYHNPECDPSIAPFLFEVNGIQICSFADKIIVRQGYQFRETFDCIDELLQSNIIIQ